MFSCSPLLNPFGEIVSHWKSTLGVAQESQERYLVTKVGGRMDWFRAGGWGGFLVREFVCRICPPCSPPLLNPSGVNRYLLLGAGPGSDLGIAHANLVDCVGVARLGLIWAGGSLSMQVGLEPWKPAYQAAGGDFGAEQVWGRRTMTLDGSIFKKLVCT